MAKLPKFIDKIIYTNNQSYPISSSFRGILRLSPNDIESFKQRQLIQLTDQDKITYGNKSNYADCIDFGSDVAEGSFIDCDIDDTMILCSDSEGYAVGFRLSSNNPEFDNLGIIGTFETKTLQLFTKGDTNTFTINGQKMPTQAQVKTTAPQTPEPSGKFFLRMYNNEWDYYPPDDFIKETIIEVLRQFETIPTGSIHWCPVTITQYKTLCEKQSKQYTHNITDSDPLVRDFLVCDGRKYLCSDFPELAKILSGEKVSNHTKVPKKDEEGNDISPIEFYYPSSRESYESEGQNENKKHYFHVPDLRHMFISSVIAKGIHGTSDNAESGDILSPDSGTYTPDCNADGITIDKNQHRHFTAYGTWQVRGYSDYVQDGATGYDYKDYYPNVKVKKDENTYNYLTYNTNPTTPVIPSDKIQKSQGKLPAFELKNNDIIGIMPLHNHPYAYYSTTGSTASGGMIGFGQRIGENNRDSHSGANSVSAAYFLSRPNFNKPALNVKFVGRSSYDIDSYDPDSKPQDTKAVAHGHENTSEFYAMLPLIKI